MEVKCHDCDGTGSYLFQVRTIRINPETKDIIYPRNPGFPIKVKCDYCHGSGLVEYVPKIIISENLVEINSSNDDDKIIPNVVSFNLFPNKTEIEVREWSEHLSNILNKDEFKQLIDGLTSLWDKMI
jgi:hypothetical protein